MPTNWKSMGVYLKVGRPSKKRLNLIDMMQEKKRQCIHEWEVAINNDLLQGEIVYRVQFQSGGFEGRRGYITHYKTKKNAEARAKRVNGVVKRYHLVPIQELEA